MNTDPQLTERLLEIQAEIEALSRKAKAAAIVQVVQLMSQYGILISDLNDIEHTSPVRKARAKYWDPQTGQTWAGRGRVPKWLVGRDLDAYRIGSAAHPDTDDSGADRQDAK
ncbi:H-NS family nucleoid-associated regulatory protein [Burkholderia sp. RF4-BP95]|uniref:H-NS histone family protein n=1 Tax=Burkholderia sp. RF4-BP95 TaxID=1637845 RepID=UPI000752BC74|nr:H-NS histone family protein [Burkholderia sp. RF4-BP95]KUY84077.1 hypothetical protein WS46_08275 [Burkholderia sp. RF4-BP95]